MTNSLIPLRNFGSFWASFSLAQNLSSFFFINIGYYKNSLSKYIKLHGGAKLHLYRWNQGFHHVSSSKSKSGQILLSHTIFFLFSIAMILSIVLAFGTIRKDTQDFVGTNEMQQVCAILRKAVDKIYLPTDYN